MVLLTFRSWTESYWQSMVENTGLAGENYLYFVSVDKDFPVLDRIKQEKLAYEKFEPWLVPIMVVSVAAFILALVGIVILTVAAGRNNEDEKVHLNFFGSMVYRDCSRYDCCNLADGTFNTDTSNGFRRNADNLGSH